MVRFMSQSAGSRLKIMLGLLILFGIVNGVIGLGDYIKLMGGVPDFNEMKASEFTEGKFVKGYVYTCLGDFVSERNATTRWDYYIMPIVSDNAIGEPEAKYISLAVSSEEHRKLLDDITANTYLSVFGGSQTNESEFYFTGKVSKLDPDVEDYLNVFIGILKIFDPDIEDYQNNLVPYEIRFENFNGVYYKMGWGALSLAAAVAALIVYNKRNGIGTLIPVYQNPVQPSGGAPAPEDAKMLETMAGLKQPPSADDFFAPKSVIPEKPSETAEPSVSEEEKQVSAPEVLKAAAARPEARADAPFRGSAFLLNAAAKAQTSDDEAPDGETAIPSSSEMEDLDISSLDFDLL